MTGPKKVVGLKYEPGEGLPQVVVKGSGPAAEEILRRRDASGGPPLVQDSALAAQLYRLPIDATRVDALTITQASLLSDVERLRVLSHNLANATTLGFRRDVAVVRPFDTHLDQAGIGASLSTTSATDIDRTPGALRYSGNPLDIALEGDGYFVLQSQAGTVFSRQGNFQLDSRGRLMGASGSVVLGASGEVVLSQAEPRIDQAGNIWEGDKLVDTLRVVRLSPDAQLTSLGSGAYASDAASLQDVEMPRVRQGYVEASNVVPMREMVRLIETMRHFEASQRVVRSYDDMMDRAFSLLGEA